MAKRNKFDEIMQAFRLFDQDNTGKITIDNLRQVARLSCPHDCPVNLSIAGKLLHCQQSPC